MLTEKEAQIMETFGAVIPKLSEADKKYFQGLGDGMAIIIKMEEKKAGEENKSPATV
jgi:hypothetical protein